MAEFKYFRHALTGKVGEYPADFGDLFYDLFTEVDPNEADCVDCWLKPEDEVIHEQIDFVQDPIDDDDFDPVIYDDNNEDK